MLKFCAVVLLLAPISAFASERVPVKIIQRQISDRSYSGFVPGYANTDVVGDSATTRYTNPHTVSYNVTGATFSLLLQDGRQVIVNCASKYSPKGDHVNRRSCRFPIIDDIEAEFKGKDAKLYWTVNLDGKKKESETYTILAIIPKP